MGILATAPRGGLAEDIGGTSRVLVLRNAEIERFEDAHRGIFTVWDGFFAGGVKPSSREVRDLVALGLVGGGLSSAEADRVMRAQGPGDLHRLYRIAQGLVGVAFVPDAAGAEDGEAPAEAADDKKKDLTAGT